MINQKRASPTNGPTYRVCNSSPNFIPRGMRNMSNIFFCSLGIPEVLRSGYFCDFVDVEGKKEVKIKSEG